MIISRFADLELELLDFLVIFGDAYLELEPLDFSELELEELLLLPESPMRQRCHRRRR